MSEAAKTNLSSETLGGTVAQFTMALIGFAGTIIFARWLGPSAFGGVYLLYALVKFADRPMNGWSLAGKKRVSESDALRPFAFGAQLLFDAGWLLLAGIVIFLASDALRNYTGLALAPVLLVCLLATESVFETIASLAQGRGRISATTWVDTLRSVFTLPLQIGFVALLSTATVVGSAGMVFGLSLASALTVPFAVGLVAARPALPSRAFVRNLAEYARYSIPSTFLGTTYDRLDVLLLGFLLANGTAAAGWYEVAWKFTLPAVFVADMAGRGLMTTVSARDERVGGAARDISNTLAYAGILAFPILFGSLALSKPLVVTVYGPDYENAAVLLIGLAAYRVVRTQSGPLLQAINGFDRPDAAMRLSALAVGINLVLGVPLTLGYGPIGVVLATIVAESVMYLGALRFLRAEIVGITPISRPMAAQVGASLVMFVAVSIAHTFVPVASWTDLLSLVSLGGAVYVGVLLVVSPGVRHTLGEAVRGSFPSS